VRPSRALRYLAILSFLAAGCGGDDPAAPEGLTLADLVGSWTASSVLHTNNADASEQFDIVAAGGEVRTTVLEGGGARTWVTLFTFSDEWDAQLSLSGNTLTSTPVESSRGVRVSTAELSGNVLTLTNANDSFDFTLTEAAGVPTTSVTVFVRQ
jgi:hypothetical protein